MGRLLSKESVREICVGTALLCCALALVCWPREITSEVRIKKGNRDGRITL